MALTIRVLQTLSPRSTRPCRRPRPRCRHSRASRFTQQPRLPRLGALGNRLAGRSHQRTWKKGASSTSASSPTPVSPTSAHLLIDLGGGSCELTISDSRPHQRHGQPSHRRGPTDADISAPRSASQERTRTDAGLGQPRNLAHSKAHSRSQSTNRSGHLGHAGGAVRPLPGQGRTRPVPTLSLMRASQGFSEAARQTQPGTAARSARHRPTARGNHHRRSHGLLRIDGHVLLARLPLSAARLARRPAGADAGRLQRRVRP